MFVPIKESASLAEAQGSLSGSAGVGNPQGTPRYLRERAAWHTMGRNGAKDFLDQLRCSRPSRGYSVTPVVGAPIDHPDCRVELVGGI